MNDSAENHDPENRNEAPIYPPLAVPSGLTASAPIKKLKNRLKMPRLLLLAACLQSIENPVKKAARDIFFARTLSV